MPVAADSTGMTLREGATVGPYRIVCHLGRGGHADVYEVVHEQQSTTHALKLLHHSSHEVRTRMIREARTQASLEHPNIVRVTDMLEHEGMIGMVMDYVQGPSLAELIGPGGLQVEDLERLATSLLSAMAAAHDAGVVHRDLKPANILIEDGVARICDFGIAKVLGQEQDPEHLTTQTGSALGTPAYMAPEQIRDARRVDQRADVYSLGVLLYEAATGRRAYPQTDVVDLMVAVANGDAPPAVTLRPDLPQRICAILDCAMSVNPDRRYASAGVMLAVWSVMDDPSTDLPAPLDWSMEEESTDIFHVPVAPSPAPPAPEPPHWLTLTTLTALVLVAVVVVGLLGSLPGESSPVEATQIVGTEP